MEKDEMLSKESKKVKDGRDVKDRWEVERKEGG